ncbi:hypothetical protein KHA95_09420 [Bacillus sp. FJAT-50079]|nr:DUF6470 family protein [Bacillus sp. FJAT-50079]MBS4208287.1 hypothetical protein [Bacillus sp. FJAT-50079]
MQIPQIRMQSQSAQIAIQSRPANQSIQQPNANLQIEQPLAEMNIRTTPGKLTIDQSQAWEDMDIKSIFKRVEENTYRAQQAVMEGIARVVREGDEMLDIRSGRNIIVEQAKRKANPRPVQTNIAWVPSPFSVKTHYTRGSIDIQFQAKKPKIDVQIRKPIISYHRGDVDISLQQRNSLKIDFVK